MRPTVVKLKISKGILVQDCDEYVGRRMTMAQHKRKDSVWGNPYPVKQYGLEESLRLYTIHFKAMILSDIELWIPRLAALEGKVLGCWCHAKPQKTKPEKATCHGDIIADYVEEVCKFFDSNPTEEDMDRLIAMFR